MEEEKKTVEEATAKAGANEKVLLQNADVDAILKTERERREKAEHELEETRRKARERIEKRKEEIPDEEEKPITRQGLEDLLEGEREKIRKELRADRVREVARKLAESDSEAELIVEVWKNRTLAGSLDEQIEEAHAIATHKRTNAQNLELKRALASKEGLVTDGANAQRKPAPKGEPDLNATDKTVVQGMTWDNAKGAYRKPIAGGRKIFFVSKDMKKRWVEDAK